ncbi:SAM-dependent methyltransferase [Streptomyces coeruleorubidus]|uniref:SAM-dependent methyltransferase n=1 Tax=Streptomyces coeruleorubidus TaxID=116188 RepID=UPI0033B0874B
MTFTLPPRVPNGYTLIDLCCKQGAASYGYYLAGFNVVGVDWEPQPRYPFPFIQADLRDLDPAWIAENFDAAAGSPPCWDHSDLKHRTGKEYDDFIPETRALFEASGLPFVIENVEGAPLKNPITLCGTHFDGLRVIRHRLFESNLPLRTPRPCPKKHPLVYTLDKRKAHYGRLDEWTAFVSVNGGGNCSKAAAAAAMGIPDGWMTKDGMNQGVPPAYTEWIGRQIADHLDAEQLAA